MWAPPVVEIHQVIYKPETRRDEPVIQALTEAAERYPRYGFKKLFQILRRQGIRTFNIVDDFNREALAIEIDLNIPAQRVVRVLDRIVATRGYPVKMRMDNGPELISLTLAQNNEISKSVWN